jgi:hypothetical protein
MMKKLIGLLFIALGLGGAGLAILIGLNAWGVAACIAGVVVTLIGLLVTWGAEGAR